MAGRIAQNSVEGEEITVARGTRNFPSAAARAPHRVVIIGRIISGNLFDGVFPRRAGISLYRSSVIAVATWLCSFRTRRKVALRSLLSITGIAILGAIYTHTHIHVPLYFYIVFQYNLWYHIFQFRKFPNVNNRKTETCFIMESVSHSRFNFNSHLLAGVILLQQSYVLHSQLKKKRNSIRCNT